MHLINFSFSIHIIFHSFPLPEVFPLRVLFGCVNTFITLPSFIVVVVLLLGVERGVCEERGVSVPSSCAWCFLYYFFGSNLITLS